MLYVGDWGGEDMFEMLKFPVLSSRRRVPGPGPDNGGEVVWEMEVPWRGVNFLLNDGTLKFGAGGDAHRTRPSGILV